MTGCTVSFFSWVGVAPSRLCNAAACLVRGCGTDNSESGDGKRRREGLVCWEHGRWTVRSKSSKRATSSSMSKSSSVAGGVGEVRRALMLLQPNFHGFANILCNDEYTQVKLKDSKSAQRGKHGHATSLVEMIPCCAWVLCAMGGRYERRQDRAE